MERKIFYLTKEKLKELKREYEQLLELERKRSLSEKAPQAIESEDLNPEFVSFQENLEFLKARISELKEILENHQLILPPSKERCRFVEMGAKVTVEVNGQRDELMIVGTLEANPALGKISNESPVGKALLGHKVGDEVVISSPVKTVYKIKAIKYEIS